MDNLVKVNYVSNQHDFPHSCDIASNFVSKSLIGVAKEWSIDPHAHTRSYNDRKNDKNFKSMIFLSNKRFLNKVYVSVITY